MRQGERCAGLVDDIVGLEPSHMIALVEWTARQGYPPSQRALPAAFPQTQQRSQQRSPPQEFYRKTYIPLGVLAGGRFYDEAGAPREMHRVLQQGAAEGRRLRQVAQEIDNQAPPCNSHWTAAEGAEVWCDSDDALPRRATRWRSSLLLFATATGRQRTQALLQMTPSPDSGHDHWHSCFWDTQLASPRLACMLQCGLGGCWHAQALALAAA